MSDRLDMEIEHYRDGTKRIFIVQAATGRRWKQRKKEDAMDLMERVKRDLEREALS